MVVEPSGLDVELNRTIRSHLPRELEHIVDGSEREIDSSRRTESRFSSVCHQPKTRCEKYGDRACSLGAADVDA
jgi:hypothetical protein